ncbi:MAG: glycosyltransferase [Actinobacteria bacterium]|nr:glycosyltransferase [Actinomycetota bacterium]
MKPESVINSYAIKPYVSVIIPTYNRSHLLIETVRSFIEQNYDNDRFEIIIANNNSPDNTSEIIDSLVKESPNSIRHIMEKRQGVHYARNSAAKVAIGDILYYTDDDMIADKNLLKEIVKVFTLDANIGTATGMIIGRFDVDPPKWVKKHLINIHLSLTAENRKEELIITPEDLVYSCHQAIRRDVFFKAGGFNPENTAGVWIGDGETGLNIKIKNLGYKFAYTSKSIIYHIIPESRTTLKYLIKRIGNQGFCDSYTEYRKHRDKCKIISLMLKRNTIGLVKTLGLTIARITLGRLSWHFLPANIMYFIKRNFYDLKLYRNESFRKIVEIDDWINSEQIIKF